jgi:hypothetical protein
MTREREPTPERVLQRALGFLTPGADDEARVLAAVQRELSGGASAPALASRPLAPAARVAQGSLAGKLALVAALTGAAGFALGFFVGRESSGVSPESALAAAAPLTTAPLATSAQPVPVPVHVPAPDDTIARDASVIATERSAAISEPVPVARRMNAPRPSAARRAPDRPVPAPSVSAFDLRQALRVLREAQRAQREGRAGAALQLLTTLDTRAPVDILAEERLVTRALALCDLGDVAAARLLARTLRAQNPSSIYQSRLRQSCAGGE